ncbi:MAG: P27 family phage terminase small subunit [Burkholderiaceae bacterium]
MSKNRFPPELHIVHGTKQEHQGGLLPENVRQRIPKQPWFDDPAKWDATEFIKTTADFLWDTYGIGSAQDGHVLCALADQLGIYIDCRHKVMQRGVIITFPNKAIGPNPYLTAGDKALFRAITLMNELGLTPKSRLATGVKTEGGKFSKLLRGPG